MAALVRLLISSGFAVLALQSSTPTYQDPGRRLTFSYPATFGSPSRGTNDGFQDRVAAVRFSAFPARYGGEAVLTRGFPLVDLQAAGGLYDSLTLEIFPEPLRAAVVSQLPRLTAANFCAALAQARHLDPNAAAFASLTPAERAAIDGADVMRNQAPRVVTCDAAGDTITFDKERGFGVGSPPQHVYGAVRFLPAPYSMFQLVAGGDPPTAATLGAVAEIVRSFQTR